MDELLAIRFINRGKTVFCPRFSFSSSDIATQYSELHLDGILVWA
jgi:hypothetical protein